jgi:carboxypeptidase Taq
MESADRAYRKLLAHLSDAAVMSSTLSLLNWDQETHMPPGGADLRASQVAQLAELLQRRRSSRTLGRLIDEAQPVAEGLPPDADVVVILREAKRDHERATRIPPKLAAERARLRSLARTAWAEAREKGEFALFLPWLENVFRLMRRWGEALADGKGDAYDALLDDHEPGADAAALRAIFGPLESSLRALLGRILGTGRTVDTSPLARPCPVPVQRAFARSATEAIGFDYVRGALDDALHPFCSTLSPDDVRLTSRYQETAFADGFFSALHEAGHGIYEQGLRRDAYGTALAEASSYGVHESQSRLWENLVGRSLGFWRHFLPRAQAAFPSLSGVPLDAFHRALNEVQPSFIRVDADETTYNLHILLRFELEQALLSGDLEARDLPDAWNERFERSFGIRPPDDRQGCLQDVHWSISLVGYFPTYTLGNVYAAQIHERAAGDLGDLDAAFAKGEFAPLRGWLADRIHRHGRRYAPRELIEKATGAPPSPGPLLRHLERRAAEVYGV